MADPLRDAVLRKDAAFVAGWLTGRWMLEVTVERAARWIAEMWRRIEAENQWRASQNLPPARLVSEWTGGSYDLWFRSQMTKEGGYNVNQQPDGSVKGKYALPENERFHVVLHVGFINIEETEEMLALLRAPDPTMPTGNGPATPGIARTEVKVQPIDRTAAKVVGLKTGES